jgi:uroporphyrinogen III methyltransferase/synthase
MTDSLVSLVGAGPGDPGLLTARGRERLVACDCLIYDYLVSPEIVAIAPTAAVRHYVGKRGGKASTSQEEINRLLVEAGKRHRRVVRLKGGDPFLFGRGGEEAVALAQAGLAFEIVPGVTSGIGAPAYAGIPVTHRAASSAVVLVTGHQQHRAGEPEPPFDWRSIAQVETIVLYMGMHRLSDNCAGLIAAGRAGTTPAAIIQWGSLPRQQVVTGTLATLPALAAAARLGAPAITVVGDVVRFREQIRWFDHPQRHPLFGRRLLVTRAREQASELVHLLREQGAAVQEIPLARFAWPEDCSALDAALGALDQFAWLAVTSANAVEFTWNRLRHLGRDARALGHLRLAAVGPATARALEAHGLHADLIPDTADSEHLARALTTWAAVAGPAAKRTILIPQADNARPLLRTALAAAGWQVATPVAYAAVPVIPEWDLDHEQPPDGITFASSATVERFLAWATRERTRAWVAGGCRLYAIGPQTAATLHQHGLPIAGVAADASIPGLVAAVVADAAHIT